RPGAALGETAAPGNGMTRARGIAAAVVLTGACALTVLMGIQGEKAAESVPIVLLAMLVGVGLAGPLIGRATAALLSGPLCRLAGIEGELAVANSRARARRLSAAITPVALMVSFALAKLTLLTAPGPMDWMEVFGTLLYVGFTALVAANTLVMVTLERVRELSLLRAVGAEDPQVVRTVLLEAVVTVVAALGTGIAAVCAALLPLGDVGGASLTRLPATAWLGTGAVVAALVLASTALPLRRVLRVRPMAGMASAAS
ncbi:ABC transporter permease, partial [Streptomyces sp. T-3]|nr:ABC transporter permease [Streptomyces sp. T-3]